MLLIVGFVISLAIILLFSKKNLWLSIIIGGVILSIFAMKPVIILDAMIPTFTFDNIMLSLALVEIPILGKILERELTAIFGGYGRKQAAIFGPATLGLLPIPGGAVLSCPILANLKQYKESSELVAINIWYRHFIFFVYPLASTLIIAVTIADIDLAVAIAYLLPVFLVSALIGYFYYIKDLPDKKNHDDKHSKRAIGIIIVAPTIQLALKILGIPIGFATFIGVSLALLLALRYENAFVRRYGLWNIAKGVKAWNFGLILISIIFYAEVFKRTPITDILQAYSIPLILFATVIPFLIGFATGRVQLSIAIIIPIILQLAGAITIGTFVMVYTLATAGYLMSPAHPCLVLSAQYFKTTIASSIRKLLVPAITLSIFAVVYGILLH